MSNFEKAHTYYSQAIVTLANPFSVSFAEVRNSSVSNIKMLKEDAEHNHLEQLKKTRGTITSIKTMLGLIKGSHDPLVQCRTSIESMLNKTNSTTIEQHAAGLFHDSDESEDGSGSGEWSDEVIIT